MKMISTTSRRLKGGAGEIANLLICSHLNAKWGGCGRIWQMAGRRLMATETEKFSIPSSVGIEKELNMAC
jgi:hypothetical protein